MKNKRTRIEDVAKLAGVSPTAVSFAFNKPDRLNPQTVERILEIANQLGYAPNPHARALLSKSVGVIGILTPQSLPSTFANPFFTAFHQGVGRICEENNCSLLTISASTNNPTSLAPVDGIIAVGLHEHHEEIQTLQRRGVPLVLVDTDSSTLPTVTIEDEHGAWMAADYLIQQGHRQIAVMTFEMDYSSEIKVYGVGERRFEGYKRAFLEHGLPWNDSFLIPTPADAVESAVLFKTHWQEGNRPTAVLAIADIIAIGVMQAAEELGLHIPDQLAVIGFDDIPQAAWTQPTLTTIRQPTVEKGEVAAQMLLNLIEGENPASTALPVELVIRQSA